MNTLKKGSDVLIRLNTNRDSFTKIDLSYYTDEANHVECTLDNGKVFLENGCYYATLNSEDTKVFNGILKCTCTMAWDNTMFNDGNQEVTKSQYLKIKFV